MSAIAIDVTTTYIELALSSILFILTLIIAIFYGVNCTSKKQTHNQTPYFKYNTLLAVIFNVLCSLSVFIYFVWITVDPIETELYFLHLSHKVRIVITVFSYISKLFPFFIFNGRLYYAFMKVRYRTSKQLFYCLNIFIIFLTPCSLIAGYVGVFIYQNPWLEWIGFNAYRIMGIVLLLTLSTMFNRRMFILIVRQMELRQLAQIEMQQVVGDSTKQSPQTGETKNIQTENINDITEYLNVVIKSSLLLTFMLVAQIMVMVIWFLHNYTLNHSHLGLTIGFLFMAFDALMDEICVLLLFKSAHIYYELLCSCNQVTEAKDSINNVNNIGFGCHRCYATICVLIASIR